jgi:lambda repressor-like predicted transcriptional regulator
MHSEHIKAELRIRFGSMANFEARRGLPPGSAGDVIRGRPVRRTAEAIAEALSLPLNTVFPGRFAGRADNTSANPDAHHLNQGAQ